MEGKEALFYERLEDKAVRCHLCERHCYIPDGMRGVCGVRENRGGTLYSLVYGRPISIAVDPIEKKPLFHYLPGTDILSLATVGCNFKCLHCQNWEISQARPEDYDTPYVPPERVVDLALHHGTQSIAYTYVEPTIFYEYARDIGVLAKEHGLSNVFVTNGYFTKDVLRDMRSWLDAMNIDLKGDGEFYRKVTGGTDVEIVRRNIRLAKKYGFHVEVTVLVVPGWNDKEDWFRNEVVGFIKDIDDSIPLHISRFFPHYKMTEVPPTPIETLTRFYEVAREDLKYVYVGNVGDPKYETTYCPNCGAPVIVRYGYHVEDRTENGRCPHCGYRIEGVWEPPGRESLPSLRSGAPDSDTEGAR
ncbi:MAG: pyruvate formate lyase activating enzyme [Candidatus Diapherotrites archaeon]|nr:pyruvate formate lyase activating enzyme [Candidatus Diapherotrites archaeon]MDN5366848.1 pyruvate formate lyase activating enzyme [Candidatus Diapherotrites archaeon]